MRYDLRNLLEAEDKKVVRGFKFLELLSVRELAVVVPGDHCVGGVEQIEQKQVELLLFDLNGVELFQLFLENHVR